MNGLRIAAVIFGIIFVVIGVLGFVPAAVIDGNLLGLFSVNTMHNLVHIVSGILALLASFKEKLSKLFFQVFTIIYGLVTILGFLMSGGMVVGMHMNFADNILHLVLTLLFLYFGFIFKNKKITKE